MKSADEARELMNNKKREFISTYLPRCLDKIDEAINHAAINNKFSTSILFLREDFSYLDSSNFSLIEEICSVLSNKGYSVKYSYTEEENILFIISWATPTQTKFITLL